MKNIYLKRMLCVVLSLMTVALLLPINAVALTSGTTGDSIIVDWEDLFGPTPSEGLVYSSNGDGTCGVSGMGTCQDTRIVIPVAYGGEPVTTIRDGAFQNQTGITEVILPESLLSIGASAFLGCTSLSKIDFPARLTSIAGRAFDGCTALTSLYVPEQLVDINANAFMNCTGLSTISVDVNNAIYSAAGNCLFTKATKTLVLGCKMSQIPTDGSVTTIGSYAFYGCTGLTSITIPAKVTVLEANAFRYCSGLQSITFADTLTSIGKNAFGSCSALANVYYGGTAEEWSENVTIGTGNTALTGATLHCHEHSGTWAYVDAGHHGYTCSCGDAITEAHNLDSFQQYNATQHKGHCSVCGTSAAYENHRWNSGVETLGTTTYTCLDCGETKIEVEVDGGAPIEYLQGDLDFDGAVDEDDVSVLRHWMAGWSGYGSESFAVLADFNNDGAVDAVDVALLKRSVAGWADVELI